MAAPTDTVADVDEAELKRAFATGQKRWPSLRLQWDTYLKHCRRSLGDPPVEGWSRFAEDLYLCAACATGSERAIGLLNSELLPLTAGSIRRIDATAAFVDEVTQTIRHKLFVGPRAKIGEYCARGPMLAWLRTVATRTALDAVRARKNQPQQMAELPDRLLKDDVNPMKGMIQSRYVRPFQEALRRGVASLSSRDRALLRMHLVGRCNIDQIGTMYGVHRATAARWLCSARELVFEFVRTELKSKHNLSEYEFSSIARGVQSKLDFEISASFSEPPEKG